MFLAMSASLVEEAVRDPGSAGAAAPRGMDNQALASMSAPDRLDRGITNDSRGVYSNHGQTQGQAWFSPAKKT